MLTGSALGAMAQAWAGRGGLALQAVAFAVSALAACSLAALVFRSRRRGVSPGAESPQDSVGGYELVKKLGSGGMGEVWEARHRLLARPAAVKLIRPQALLGEDPAHHGVIEKRFCREAAVTATLQCPHTVALYDFGRSREASFYYVMELLRGLDLRRLVQRFGPMEPARVVAVLTQVCKSLDEAHSMQLVHRDIKPDNLYLCRLGREYDFVKVLDFGLVKDRGPGGGTPLTAVGTVYGTPGFMAPEQVMGLDLDGRTDLYALGCVAYWMLTGQEVFGGTTMIEIATAHIQQAPPPPSTRCSTAVPGELEQIVMRCLAKKPDHRPQCAAELGEMLAACRLEAAWTPAHARAWWQQNLPQHTTLASPRASDEEWTLDQARKAVAELLVE